jgi:hypothetical protein
MNCSGQSPQLNKKFWEELIAYFPVYDTGHIENDASNNSSIIGCVFVTTVKFLLSRCLATVGGFLPSRCLATIEGFLPSRCLATIRRFLLNRFLATIRGIRRHTHRETATWSHKPTLIFQNKESGLKILLSLLHSHMLIVWLTLGPWRKMQYIPPKSR